MIRRRAGFTMIELVVVVAVISILIALLLPAVQAAREAARRAHCSNNLLQLGIAIENYESTHQVLPPGVIDRSAPVIETLASYQFAWIARILPYLEQKNVYNRIDFNSGVYTANNLTARGVSMNVLLCPADGGRPAIHNGLRGSGESGGGAALSSIVPATTAYAACHNDVESPIENKNSGVFFLNSRVRLDEIEDGLGHTIFLGEKRYGGDELGWASGTRATLRNTGTPINRTVLASSDLDGFQAEVDAVYRPEEARRLQETTAAEASSTARPRSMTVPVGGFGSSHPNGANFLFGDGSVHFLRPNITQRVFRLLGSRADGEPIGDDQF